MLCFFAKQVWLVFTSRIQLSTVCFFIDSLNFFVRLSMSINYQSKANKKSNKNHITQLTLYTMQIHFSRHDI